MEPQYIGDWSFLIEHERIYVYQPSGTFLIDLDITRADTLVSLLNAGMAELTRQTTHAAAGQPDNGQRDSGEGGL